MSNLTTFFVLLYFGFILSGCSPDDVRPMTDPGASFGDMNLKVDKNASTVGFKGGPSKVCGKMVLSDLITPQFQDIGNLVVSNNEDSVYLTFLSEAKLNFNRIELFIGPDSELPVDATGQPDLASFPFQKQLNKPKHLQTFAFSRKNLDTCLAIVACVHALTPNGSKSTAFSTGFLAPGSTFITGNDYCMQVCHGKCHQDLRTQTQSQWGGAPLEGSPAKFLVENWSSVFPSGLTVGCPAGYNLTLNSSNAVDDFIPSSGQPMVLLQSWTNPGGKLSNTLVGEVVALSISVAFDSYMPNFGAANQNLGKMEVMAGPFQGWTVNQVLAEANNAIGGCGTQHTISEIYDTLKKINHNYTGGTVDNGFLTCP